MIHVGMLTVKPMKGNADLGHAAGAVVNVLLLTQNAKTYAEEVVVKMEGFGYEVVEIEDVEKFVPSNSYADDLRGKARLLIPEHPLQWRTFYTFDSFDEE